MANDHRVVIYVRISKDRADQTSTETQREDAIKYAESRGWEVVKVCEDVGRSAYKKNVKRQGFDEAMSLIATGQANVFLVWKLNRFYRSLSEFTMAWHRIRSAGAELVSVTEPTYDTSDPMGMYAVMGFAAMAEVESKTKSDQSKRAHAVRLREGRIPNGIRPFGYMKPSKGQLVIDEAEARFIRVAAGRILNGESLRSILRTETPITESGKPMTPRGLRFVLTCPRTAGLRRDPKTQALINGAWEPILSRETWENLNTLFDDPARLRHTSNRISHVLSGIMRCGKHGCNDTMNSRTWKDGYRYQCRTCGNSIGESTADAIVRQKVLDICPQDRWESYTTQGRGFDASITEPIQQRLDELTIDQMAETDARKRNLMQAAIDRLEAQLAATAGEYLNLPSIGNLADEWDSLPLDDVRAVITFLTSSITLAPVKGGTKDPMRRITVSGT